MLLTRTLILTCCLAVSVLAQGLPAVNSVDNGYVQLDLKEVTRRSAEFEGRRVAITAEVVSVSADSRTLNVFDSGSKTLVVVYLSQLSKSQRQALVHDPVVRVSVFGRIEMKNGRAVIKADQVMPLAASLVAQK